jgi:CDP-glucose 4,6-dehydratase
MLDIPRHQSVEGDINDTQALGRTLAESGASILIHLAAQAIVLRSYEDPLGTFRDNVLGTASVLEAARKSAELDAIVVVTSDKVYENRSWAWGYRETEALGGHDPYSASKAAADIVARSMSRSYFASPQMPCVATARAGNVIGGGDWAEFRLLPDAARAFIQGEILRVRNPLSRRPWQHVLEPLVGYLQLAQTLACVRDRAVPDAWNFGPVPEDAVSVGEVVGIFANEWGRGADWQAASPVANPYKEADLLAVDASLARTHLGWRPRWRVEEAVRRTAAWYRDHSWGQAAMALVARDIDDYLEALV